MQVRDALAWTKRRRRRVPGAAASAPSLSEVATAAYGAPDSSPLVEPAHNAPTPLRTSTTATTFASASGASGEVKLVQLAPGEPLSDEKRAALEALVGKEQLDALLQELPKLAKPRAGVLDDPAAHDDAAAQRARMINAVGKQLALTTEQRAALRSAMNQLDNKATQQQQQKDVAHNNDKSNTSSTPPDDNDQQLDALKTAEIE